MSDFFFPLVKSTHDSVFHVVGLVHFFNYLMRNPLISGHWQVSCASVSLIARRLRHLLVAFCNFCVSAAKHTCQFSPVSRN